MVAWKNYHALSFISSFFFWASLAANFRFFIHRPGLAFFCYCIFYQVGLSFSSRKKSLSGGTITSISLLSSTRFCSPSSSTHSLSHSLSFFPDSVRLVYLFHSLLPVYQYYHNYYDWPSNLKTDSEEWKKICPIVFQGPVSFQTTNSSS